MSTPLDYSSAQLEQAESQAIFMTKVYGWMTTALIVTALAAMFVVNSPTVAGLLFGGGKMVFYGLVIGELALVWWLSSRIQTMSTATATTAFFAYAFINGLTISYIFFMYTMGSIAGVFFVTAGTFGAMSLYGYYTKSDLSSWGNLLFMALIGLIIASVVNMFWANSTLYWITTYAGVLIFVGLTAYDTQKIKEMASVRAQGDEAEHKASILGALSLYLDFINLFIYLLRILGSRD